MTNTVEDIYQNGTYLSNHPDWHDEDGPWKARQITTILKRNQLAPRSVCDVGCGTGRVLSELSTYLPAATRLVGFDTATDPVKIYHGRNHPGIEVVTGDARNTDERFDLLMMIDVFEHVEDYLGFLRAFKDSADHFIFHIPLDMTIQAVWRMRPIMRARQGVGHLHYFCRETALATLQDAGYRVQDEIYTSGGLELPGGGRERKFAKLPRTLLYRLDPHIAARFLGGFSLLVLCKRS